MIINYANIIHRAEFLTGSVVSTKTKDEEKPSFQEVSQDSPRTLDPANHGSQSGFQSNRPSWSNEDPHTGESYQDNLSPKVPYSDAPMEDPSFKIQPRETIQPQEVYRGRIPLEKIGSPVGLTDASIKKIDRTSPQPTTAKKINSGETARHIDEAADAKITEVIRTALAGTISIERANENPSLRDSNRNSPMDIKSSPEASWISEPNSATGSLGGCDVSANHADHTCTKDELIVSQAQKNAVEVLKMLHEHGYVVQKDPSFSPKIKNAGSAASNKSEHQVTCTVCNRFKGRPCELKYVLLFTSFTTGPLESCILFSIYLADTP